MVKVTPHICRHTFATDMAIRGLNPVFLKQILGHDDISTTFSIYTHIKENDSVDEFKELGLINTEEKVPANGSAKIIDFAGRTA